MTEAGKQRITEPGELDVLCGRGGMSNHHPGNEWYRRLIKSNRPLYRACPKHTKLLVSKAIVQAVEQQGGRFLEKNKNDNSWFEVSYKKAVDKTSQGLRERDREDENSASEVTNSAPIISPPPRALQQNGNTFVGTQSKVPATVGRTAQDNALAEATKQNTSNKNKPLSQKRTAFAFEQQEHEPRQSKRNCTGQTEPVYNASEEEEDFAPLPPSLQQRESSMFRLLKQTKLLAGQGDQNWGAVPTNSDHDTHMTSSSQEHPPKFDDSYANGIGGAGNIYGQSQRMAYQGKSLRQLELLTGRKADSTLTTQELMRLQKQNSALLGQLPWAGQNANSLAAAPFPSSSAVGAADFPALTRLTSQMSDWLTSFWPVPTRGESVANPSAASLAARGSVGPFGYAENQGKMAPGETQNQFANLGPDVINGTNPDTLANFQKEVAPKLVNVPPPKLEIPPITTVLPNPRRSHDAPKLAMPQRHDQEEPQIPLQAGGISSKRNKRKSTPGLPVIPIDGNTTELGPSGGGEPKILEDKGDGMNEPYKQKLTHGLPESEHVALAPTELEQSVSATLLKLAGAPSRLYGGLSSLFGSNQNGRGDSRENSNENSESVGNVGADQGDVSGLNDINGRGQIPAISARMTGRKSSASLLDDDEDTPMEVRLRGYGSQNSSTHQWNNTESVAL